MAFRLLKFGEFDEGGIDNNLAITAYVPFEWALGVKRYEIVKFDTPLIDGFLSPQGEQFQYFRVLHIIKAENNRCMLVCQAYNHTSYSAFGRSGTRKRPCAA